MHDAISRRNTVERIARRYGYSRERAEDIAQEAALQLIAKPNLISQSAKQAFIDALRSGGEGIYSRAGVFTQPIYEGHFEDCANFINCIGSGYNLESEQIVRSELSDTISCFKILSQRERMIMEMYAEGFRLDEISKRFGFCESRALQIIKLSRIKIKKAIVSKGLSQQKQRRREWKESQALSREGQTRSGIQRQMPQEMGSFFIETVKGMVSFKIPKIPQSLFTSF